MKRNMWVGFDLGGTKMLAMVLDESMKIRSRVRKKVRTGEGASATLDRIVAAMDEALTEAGVNRGSLVGAGIGVPGALDLDRGVLINAPNLGWKQIALKTRLEKKLGCSVMVLNDVDAGIYGEYRSGAAQGARCALGVFPGTGIGGGCVYEGNLIRGKRSSCMEIGHVQMIPDGPLCGCGRRGCLEAVSGRLAVSAAAAMAAYRKEAPHLLARAGTDLANIKSGVIAAAIKDGDVVVEKIVRQAARWLGIAVGDTINLLAPDVIVLGGGLVEAMPMIYRQEVELGTLLRVMPGLEKTFRITIARLGDDAVAVGAAHWCRHLMKPGK